VTPSIAAPRVTKLSDATAGALEQFSPDIVLGASSVCKLGSAVWPLPQSRPESRRRSVDNRD